MWHQKAVSAETIKTHLIYLILEMSAYFYLLLQICNLPYCSDTTISLCISNVGIVRISITVAWSNLKTQPARYLHISGGRLPQILAKQARQRDKMKGKTFLLPLFLPTSLPWKKPWEVGSGEQTLMCFGGEKLNCGAGNGTGEQVTAAAHQQPQLHTGTWKPHSLRWSSSNPGLKLQKAASLTKGQRLKSPSPIRLTQEFNCKYAIAVLPWLACFTWWKGSLQEMRGAKRQGQLSS